MALIAVRPVPEQALRSLLAAGIDPVLARVLAARGVLGPAEIELRLESLIPPAELAGAIDAARLLADSIAADRPILVVADYDCDGATGCAVAVRGLRLFGARVDYLVPNRLTHGYGLTPSIVDLGLSHPRLGRPALLVTVDNGIASVDGVDHARACGLDVIITDHHLPGDRLPCANAIVNPNQPGCRFPSKALAGVGVMFYLLLALRAELRGRGAWTGTTEPTLSGLLDLVALGTIADLVPLDRNNRVLVSAGLRRIRAGRCCEGLRALLAVAGRTAATVGSADLGFHVGPRINAAGRLADISIGIECLLSDDPAQAAALAERLDRINRERRDLQQDMQQAALADSAAFDAGTFGAVLFREPWHEGVIGLVASRVKDRLHRPTIAFAVSSDPTLLRGSGRSIHGVHLRDVLDVISKRMPGAIDRFGGHAMAAGLTLRRERLDEFAAMFQQVVPLFADPGCFDAKLLTDGALAPALIDYALVDLLDGQVWGQAFAAPVFSDDFEVVSQRIVGERHLRLDLRLGTRRLPAIAFGRTAPLPARSRLAYRLTRDDYGGQGGVQLVVESIDEDAGRQGAPPGA